MQLTKHTDFAFRALIYLAAMEDELTTIQTITDRFAISKSHAMKIINKMVNRGWVKSVRGKNGGIALACPANEIVLSDVIKTMENNLAPVNCDSPRCLIAGACILRGVLAEAQQAYFDHLSRYTLADILHEKTRRLLLQAS